MFNCNLSFFEILNILENFLTNSYILKNLKFQESCDEQFAKLQEGGDPTSAWSD